MPSVSNVRPGVTQLPDALRERSRHVKRRISLQPQAVKPLPLVGKGGDEFGCRPVGARVEEHPADP
jgi:hypothetical protein